MQKMSYNSKFTETLITKIFAGGTSDAGGKCKYVKKKKCWLNVGGVLLVKCNLFKKKKAEKETFPNIAALDNLSFKAITLA